MSHSISLNFTIWYIANKFSLQLKNNLKNKNVYNLKITTDKYHNLKIATDKYHKNKFISSRELHL